MLMNALSMIHPFVFALTLKHLHAVGWQYVPVGITSPGGRVSHVSQPPRCSRTEIKQVLASGCERGDRIYNAFVPRNRYQVPRTDRRQSSHLDLTASARRLMLETADPGCMKRLVAGGAVPRRVLRRSRQTW